MDLVTGLQRALDYLEGHLTEEDLPGAAAGRHTFRPSTLPACSPFSAAIRPRNIFACAG